MHTGGEEVNLHAFLSSGLVERELSAACSGVDSNTHEISGSRGRGSKAVWT
jgi:hypothetical protein